MTFFNRFNQKRYSKVLIKNVFRKSLIKHVFQKRLLQSKIFLKCLIKNVFQNNMQNVFNFYQKHFSKCYQTYVSKFLIEIIQIVFQK